jgi:hypothetical protein
LAISVLVLPIAELVVVGAARLLAAMQDPAGAAILDRLALAGGLVWVIALVLLVVGLAIKGIDERPD